MDEIFVRRDVIDGAKLRGLCVASDRAGAIQTLSHIGAIAVTGTALWLTRGTGWAVPVFAMHGVLLNFLYAGQHELSHWTVFRTGWLNEWVGRLFGFVLFYPRTFDQVQHMAHHRFTQDWSRDGELARGRYTLASYLLWMSGVSYWYTRWRRILRFCCGVVVEPYLPAKRHAELIREARWHAAGYALIAGISLWALSSAAVILWLAPMLAMKARSSAAKYHRALGPAARRQCAGQYPQHPHQCTHALAWLADAVSHRASRLSRSAVSPSAGIARRHIYLARRGASVDDLPGISDGGPARLRRRQGRGRLSRRPRLDCRPAAWVTVFWFTRRCGRWTA